MTRTPSRMGVATSLPRTGSKAGVLPPLSRGCGTNDSNVEASRLSTALVNINTERETQKRQIEKQELLQSKLLAAKLREVREQRDRDSPARTPACASSGSLRSSRST